jgi:hypothetical protein
MDPGDLIKGPPPMTTIAWALGCPFAVASEAPRERWTQLDLGSLEPIIWIIGGSRDNPRHGVLLHF